MKYTTDSGKVINIPDTEIADLMKKLDLTEVDAIDLWLCDNEYEEDIEQEELNEKAKKVKTNLHAQSDAPKSPRKPKTVKISDEKQKIFSEIKDFLAETYKIDVETDNKLLKIYLNGKEFKLNLSETRAKKK